uniref:cell wall hydrolase n=1 Tax=Pararhizobium sp. IMCC3301 TaxID=3067904 RepID=UPI002741CC10|nr:cell wall hydrolase [Pararhizobium sp. IMCC3301]
MLLARARANERAIVARRQARMAGLAVSTALGALLLFATPSQSSLPEFIELADADSYILLTPMQRSAVRATSSQTNQQIESSGVLTASVETGSPPKVSAKDPANTPSQNVNRDAKEDLQMTRSRAIAIEPNTDLPHSGNLFELRDLFSAVDEEMLPRSALAAPGWPSKDQIALATNQFSVPGTLRQRSRSMVANAQKAKPAIADTTGKADPLQVALAYAPVDNMEEFKSPFSAILNMPKPPAVRTLPGRAAVPLGTPKIKRGGTIQSASLAAASLDKEKRTVAPEPQISIAGRIPTIRPDISEIAKSDGIENVAVVRPEIGTKDHVWAANKLPRASYSRREQRCLAAAVYFEARGEPVSGQAAVAQVVLNRVKAPAYPASICGVVYQNKKWRNRCQFSFACDGARDKVTDKKSYAQAQKVAKEVTNGKQWSRAVGSATHYHATYVSPRWAKSMKRMTKIGRHIFYQTYNGGWS